MTFTAMLHSLGELYRCYLRVYRHRWWWDRAEIALLRSVLKRGDTAVDVGAYKGGYTYWMHRAVGRGGHVVAFEPQAETAAYLREQAKLLRMPGVTVENVAVSSSLGTAQLAVPEAGRKVSPGATLESAAAAQGAALRSVATETLDHYFGLREHLAPIRFMKIDVEGHEMSVFRGGEETLRRHKPVLLFECERRHHGGEPIAPVFEYLQSLGYRGSFFLRGKRLPVDSFHPVKHQTHGRKPYVNNFVFEP